MMTLRKAGLITSVAGHAKPALALQPEQITLLAVYRAVEGNKPLLHLDTHTNLECGIGINIQLSLQYYYDEIQKVSEAKMAEVTLQDIIDTYLTKYENSL